MQLTPGECMEAIVSAIFAASKDPLSIITAGVGDGAIRPCLLDVPKGTLRQHRLQEQLLSCAGYSPARSQHKVRLARMLHCLFVCLQALGRHEDF